MRWLVILLCVALSGCGQWEGYSETPYRDPVNRVTVCHGHKIEHKAKGSYDWQECEAFRIADAGSAIVAAYTCAKPITAGQLIAFADLAYNIGRPAFCRASVSRLSRQGLLFESCRELRKYVYADGKRLKGLVARREYFANYCRSNLWPV